MKTRLNSKKDPMQMFAFFSDTTLVGAYYKSKCFLSLFFYLLQFLTFLNILSSSCGAVVPETSSCLSHNSAIISTDPSSYKTSLNHTTTNNDDDDDDNHNNNNNDQDHHRNNHVVRISSYNILTEQYATEKTYPFNEPKYLNPEFRFNLIMKKLENEIHSKTILCLQEVSLKWSNRLHSFFIKNHYHFIYSSYDSKKSGYMGVAIAYPMELYHIEQIEIHVISDTKENGWIDTTTNNNNNNDDNNNNNKGTIINSMVPSFMKNIFHSMIPSFVNLLKGKQPQPIVKDDWEIAQWRKNRAIFIRLSFINKNANNNNENHKNKNFFWVGNYHMPCAFRNPQVMMIHSLLYIKKLQSLVALCKDKKYILCGDFNIQPSSFCYDLLSKGYYKEEDLIQFFHKNKNHLDDSWEPKLTNPNLISVYKEFYGSEPDFTNNARQWHSDEPFTETLDYILIPGNSGWSIKDVMELPKKCELQGRLFPDENEPSDHIMISATLTC